VLVHVHEVVVPMHAFDVPVATHVPCAHDVAGSKAASATTSRPRLRQANRKGKTYRRADGMAGTSRLSARGAFEPGESIFGRRKHANVPGPAVEVNLDWI
jgi:hypothetical protein